MLAEEACTWWISSPYWSLRGTVQLVYYKFGVFSVNYMDNYYYY